MAVTLHILGASGRLQALEAQIRSAFSDAVARVSGVLTLPGVDVVVADNPPAAIPETGVGGYAPTAHLLYVSINPEHAALASTIDAEIKSTLAHELHHCVRWESIGYGSTLLEACISEGLADHFDVEMNHGAPKPWSTAVRGQELEALIEKARSEFDTAYDEQVWFWGAGAAPRWAAYAIGFKLVGDYLKKTGKTASKLVAESARSFIA